MIRNSIIMMSVCLACGGLSHAQKDTAAHRALYQEINDGAADMQSMTGKLQGDDGRIALTAWKDDDGIRKIVAKEPNGTVTEYYLQEEEPMFVFRMFKDGDGVKVEERLYFKDGEIFKWLTTEKNAPVFHAEDYQATTEMHVDACTNYLKALKKPGKQAQAGGDSLEGVFAGLEQGDYTHWKMKLKDGSERSFFVLQTTPAMEKALDDPEKFSGRKCRITWKKSTEELPEAGGKVEIEKLLGVEWMP